MSGVTQILTPALLSRIAGAAGTPLASGNEVFLSMGKDIQALYACLVTQGGMIAALEQMSTCIDDAAVPAEKVEELR